MLAPFRAAAATPPRGSCNGGGAYAVKEELYHDGALQTMMREARHMLELRDDGGVPLPLALGFQSLTTIQGFVGESYDNFLLQCSVQGMLRSLVLLCHRLGELHARGVVHNDLKVDNITVSGGMYRPVLNIIDLGWGVSRMSAPRWCNR